MKHVSNKKLHPDLEKKSLGIITQEIKEINSSAYLSVFLRRYFTDKEKDLIIRRVAVKVLLKERVSYRKIKELLEISQNTISRVRDLLEGRGYGRNPERKRKYTPLQNFKKKEKKLFPKYKGAESIV